MLKSIACSLLLIIPAAGRRQLAFVPNSNAATRTSALHSVAENRIPEPSNEWGIPDSKLLPPFQSKPTSKLPNGGRVTLVGSGPGDPNLLTVAAYRLLTENPDALVIADRLVSQEILDLISGQVKVARKLPGCAELAQEEIYWWTYQALNQGKHVIRLKIGDPFVFGRGGEEVLMFRKYGVEPKVIPVSLCGVTCMAVADDDFEVTCTDSCCSYSPLLTGCFSCILGSSLGIHPRDTSRSVKSSCHVHRIRARGNVARLDSIP